PLKRRRSLRTGRNGVGRSATLWWTRKAWPKPGRPAAPNGYGAVNWAKAIHPSSWTQTGLTRSQRGACSPMLINEDLISIRIYSHEAGWPRGVLVRLL